jgi:DNA-binding transcriptional LysR family regulator
MTVPTLDHLRTFVTVVRVGSITGAARLLGLGQATVSAHVQALESHVGHPLLVRERSGVRPTARGAELARETGRHVEALEALIDGPVAAVDGRRAIHIGGPAEALSIFVVPDVLALSAQADAAIHLRFGLADELVEALRGGELDVVLSASRPRVRGVEATVFMDEEFVLVAAPLWEEIARTGGVDGIPVVAYGEELPIVRRYWRSVFGRRPDSLSVAAIVPDLRGVLEAVRVGAGMSVLPTYLVDPLLRSGEVVLIDEPTVRPLNTVFLVTRAGEVRRDPTVSAVVEAIRALAP